MVWSLCFHFVSRTDLVLVGSVQTIIGIPDDIKAVYRTAFELDPHVLIDMAVARSPFVDQSQSFSLFVAQPTPPLLVRWTFFYLWIRLTVHAQMDLQLHAWRAGLKTGAYYVRSKPSSEALPYGVSRSSLMSMPCPPCPSESSDSFATAETSGSVAMEVCPYDV